jgi:hypothetical protein
MSETCWNPDCKCSLEGKDPVPAFSPTVSTYKKMMPTPWPHFCSERCRETRCANPRCLATVNTGGVSVHIDADGYNFTRAPCCSSKCLCGYP